MPNINAFQLVVHEKKIFKGFCYINLYKICPLRAWPFETHGLYLNKLESPAPNNAPMLTIV